MQTLMIPALGDALIQRVTARRRSVVFGHRAVMALGLKPLRRATILWVEPGLDPLDWLALVAAEGVDAGMAELLNTTGGVDLSAEAGEQIYAFARHVDLEGVTFEEVWQAGSDVGANCRLASALDLFMISLARPAECMLLEDSVQAQLQRELPNGPAERALRLMDRYADPQSLFLARLSAHPAVREKAKALLTDFAKQGDPFSADFLDKWDENISR
jgi:hypothetical protein